MRGFSPVRESCGDGGKGDEGRGDRVLGSEGGCSPERAGKGHGNLEATGGRGAERGRLG